MAKTINDLPAKLVGEKILAKVPITSLREVRSTCKLWERLSKNWIVGKEAARQHQFLGFIILDDKVCSLRFHLRRKGGEEEDSVGVDLSIKQVNLLNQIEIKSVIHCDGLLLCVPLDKSSKLVAWNPYLGQTRSISARTDFDVQDSYHLGYDLNRNHKILRFLSYENVQVFEIYDFSSNSWKVLEVRPDWIVEYGRRGVSLKGNTYFLALVDENDNFLLCFDFTTERFGQRLLLPFDSFGIKTLTLSSVRDEKLALLHQIPLLPGRDLEIEALEIWLTTKIEPNAVAWTKFMKVDMRPLIGDRLVWFSEDYGSFFIDEEEKLVVVFDMDGYEFCGELTKTAHYHTAFIIGDDGYYTTLLLGEAPDLYKPPNPDYSYPPGYSGYVPQLYSPPLVCSSAYLPSLMQLGQLRKWKQRHGK